MVNKLYDFGSEFFKKIVLLNIEYNVDIENFLKQYKTGEFIEIILRNCSFADPSFERYKGLVKRNCFCDVESEKNNIALLREGPGNKNHPFAFRSIFGTLKKKSNISRLEEEYVICADFMFDDPDPNLNEKCSIDFKIKPDEHDSHDSDLETIYYPNTFINGDGEGFYDIEGDAEEKMMSCKTLHMIGCEGFSFAGKLINPDYTTNYDLLGLFECKFYNKECGVVEAILSNKKIKTVHLARTALYFDKNSNQLARFNDQILNGRLSITIGIGFCEENQTSNNDILFEMMLSKVVSAETDLMYNFVSELVSVSNIKIYYDYGFGFMMGNKNIKRLLKLCIDKGAKILDFETDAPDDFVRHFMKKLNKYNYRGSFKKPEHKEMYNNILRNLAFMSFKVGRLGAKSNLNLLDEQYNGRGPIKKLTQLVLNFLE
jgi:hypothetical protein